MVVNRLPAAVLVLGILAASLGLGAVHHGSWMALGWHCQNSSPTC